MKKFLLSFLLLFNFLFAADSLVGKEYKDLNLKQELCPIKNVSIEKYIDWLGYIEFADGSIVAISSPKYTFVYYFIEEKNNKNIKGIYLTDNKTKKIINAKNAFYVFGSNLMSIGGDDVIPFSEEEDSKEFFDRAHGKKIFKYERMTENFINYLDLR
ncbi:nitrous oxide reductase accessory protein NosL [Aliarcobacter butzleri]|uniref:nitrous oxide reductase accessory protein NosL n=1 Tax=Aliarcobacter butzleri TaxID=28197 RepID=UPI00125EA226|nr:nitrous oxide reductase accessory protein NosL [Aliarcobacter butzleri]MCT7553901.1 nitrous oxide reductase accessory protein NosL [Aliarcobacter butzleri]MCT7588089.1 nitrous oxide reductase accessory protein NosL [Aliarcobacter butzleri]MCT7614938.1 nitrous oxide reductase accessory protein NosL [Aliarcobacter butzleri]